MVTKILFDANLSDFMSHARPDLQPVLYFLPSGPGVSANQLLFTAPNPIVPAASGAFTVELPITENISPDVWFKLRIIWLDAAGQFRGQDDPQWQIRVPAGATSFGDLIQASSPTFTIESATRPSGEYAYWLNTTSGDLYKWSGGDYVLITNLKGPQGADGEQGADGLPGVNAVPAADAVAAYIAASEGDAGNQVDLRAAAILAADPRVLHRQYIAADTTAARMSVAGPVEWLTTVDVIPANIRLIAPVGVQPDSWAYVDPATIPWAPLTDSGLQMFYDSTNPSAPSAAPADNTALTIYQDAGPKDRDLTINASSGVGGSPLYRTALFGGKPATTYPYTSSLQSNFFRTGLSIAPTTHILIGANVQFGTPGAASRTAWTFGGGTNGSFSLFKTTTGAWGVSVDGATAYTGGTADTSPHSVLLYITATHVTLWVDGTAVIDTDHASTRGTVTSFRIGYVAVSTNTATSRPFNGGSVGDFFAVWRDTAPNLAGMRAWLAGRR